MPTLEKREKIAHNQASFPAHLISTTSHPWFDHGGNKKWKGGRCSWQGGESRCALGRRGDHKYQRCLALSFARTRSTLLYILRINSNSGSTILAIWPRPWFWLKWIYNQRNKNKWTSFDVSSSVRPWCSDFWPIASIGGQTALCNCAELASLWLDNDCLSINSLLYTAPWIVWSLDLWQLRFTELFEQTANRYQHFWLTDLVLPLYFGNLQKQEFEYLQHQKRKLTKQAGQQNAGMM